MDDPDLDEAHKKFRYAVAAYVFTILVGLLVPTVAIFLYFAVAVYLFVPFRTVSQAIFGGAEKKRSP